MDRKPSGSSRAPPAPPASSAERTSRISRRRSASPRSPDIAALSRKIPTTRSIPKPSRRSGSAPPTAGENGQKFNCETGQETPITLVRAIRDVGLDNVGVNFDVANLILYGKGNPADAVDILGPYAQGMHAKDGLYPTDPKSLGKEVPIGQGRVDFPTIISKLKAIGYKYPITIEREIRGPQQEADLRAAKAYLEKLIG